MRLHYVVPCLPVLSYCMECFVHGNHALHTEVHTGADCIGSPAPLNAQCGLGAAERMMLWARGIVLSMEVCAVIL